jgi:predicted Zn-dependent peptidase
VRQGITAAELEFAVSYLSGSFAFELATAADRLARKLDAALLGLPDDTTSRYLSDLAALDATTVNAALHRHLSPAASTIVLTGTEDLAEPLSRAGLTPEIIDFEDDPGEP